MTEIFESLKRRTTADCTRCIICNHKIGSDEDKEFVYYEDSLVGAIHAACHQAVQTVISSATKVPWQLMVETING